MRKYVAGNILINEHKDLYLYIHDIDESSDKPYIYYTAINLDGFFSDKERIDFYHFYAASDSVVPESELPECISRSIKILKMRDVIEK